MVTNERSEQKSIVNNDLDSRLRGNDEDFVTALHNENLLSD